MALIDLVANLASFLTIVSFLSGTSICRNIYRAGSTVDLSPLPFLVGTLCGYLWLRYGLLLNDYIMISVNIIGLSLQSLYLLWFYIFTAHKSQLNRRIFALVSFFLFIHLYIKYSIEPDTLVGLFACLSSLFFCASPLPLVFDVLETKCTEKLPFGLIFSSFMVTLMWFTYGYLIGDAFVQLPNGIGAILSGVQLSLFLIYPSKRNIEIIHKMKKEKLIPKLMEWNQMDI